MQSVFQPRKSAGQCDTAMQPRYAGASKECQYQRFDRRIVCGYSEGTLWRSHCWRQKNEGFHGLLPRYSMWHVAGNFVKGRSYHTTEHAVYLRVILSYEYLWQNIRVKGGAYGMHAATLDRIGDGILCFLP